MSFYKHSFFEAFIRPLVKTSSSTYFNNDPEDKLQLREGVNKALKLMQEEETNCGLEFSTEVNRIVSDPNYEIDLGRLDALRREDSWNRITRGEINFDLTQN
jgi:hypothetical protein